MKVGTDGVLLGAWAPLDGNPQAILDVGAGTGLLALMLAQRSAADTIDAVEIDAEAYATCVQNFEASPWADRLFCYHASLAEFASEFGPEYDLIVSNPPYHAETVGSGKPARDQARQQRALPFPELLEGVAALLRPTGQFSLILPYKEEEPFLSLAARYGLYPRDVVRVSGRSGAPPKRSLLHLLRDPVETHVMNLCIHDAGGAYSEAYRHLTRDFYL